LAVKGLTGTMSSEVIMPRHTYHACPFKDWLVTLPSDSIFTCKAHFQWVEKLLKLVNQWNALDIHSYFNVAVHIDIVYLV